jgi:hypothetical protein
LGTYYMINNALNRNVGLLSLLATLMISVFGMFAQNSFDRLFGGIDQMRETQAVMQTRMEHNTANMQNIRLDVKDSNGQIQNLVIRVSILEEKSGLKAKNP